MKKIILFFITMFLQAGDNKVNVNFREFGGTQICKSMFEFIRKNLPSGATILEFGSGWSTGQFAKFYKIYSIEHNKYWLDKYDSNYIYAPIKNGWYDTEIIKNNLPGKYDLILVDGPPGRIGRMGFFDNINLFNTNVPIIIDDVNRPAERELLLKLSKLLNVKPRVYKCEDFKSFAVLLPNKDI